MAGQFAHEVDREREGWPSRQLTSQRVVEVFPCAPSETAQSPILKPAAVQRSFDHNGCGRPDRADDLAALHRRAAAPGRTPRAPCR
jgi:hypothetical protein